eukprot:Colp12_sorted_trinity150504_noHs@5066
MLHTYRGNTDDSSQAFAQRYQDFVRGAVLQSRCKEHPGVLLVKGVTQGLVLVTEYMEDGQLSSLVDAGKLTLSRATHIARQLVSALTFVHMAGLTHRSVCVRSVYVAAGAKVVKLGGFWQAWPANSSTNGPLVTDPALRPPEVVSGQAYTQAGDVWQFGRLLEQLIKATDSSSLTQQPPNVVKAAELLNLIAAQCLSEDPAKRPQWRDVYQSLDMVAKMT